MSDLRTLLADVRALAEKAELPALDIGIAGGCNLVYFDGEDVHGVGRVHNLHRAAFLVALVNLWPRLLALAEGETGARHGRCQGCGEWVEIDHGESGHTRSEHDPRCDGDCSVGCPVPVARGPVDPATPPPAAQDRARARDVIDEAIRLQGYRVSGNGGVMFALYFLESAIAAALAQARGAGET